MKQEVSNEMRQAFMKMLAQAKDFDIEDLDKALNTYARFEERLSKLDDQFKSHLRNLVSPLSREWETLTFTIMKGW